MVLLFYFIKALLYVLYIVSPVLIVAAIIINWRAVWDTAREFWALLQERPLSGLITLVLAALLYPITALYLLLRALGYRQMEQAFGYVPREPSTAEYGEYIEFEEIETNAPKQPPSIEDIEIEPIPPPDDLPKDGTHPK